MTMNKTDAELSLTPENQQALERHGVALVEVERQWGLLTDQPQRICLDRPCTLDDGLELLADHQRPSLLAAHQEAAGRGRWQKFVPASGAASRMFALSKPEEKRRFCESIDRFAFAEQVHATLRQRRIDLAAAINEEAYDRVIDAIVCEDGLGFAQLAKGLLPFHAYADGTRTPFVEHLLEAIACLSRESGEIQAHFTVSADSRAEFRRQLDGFGAQTAGAAAAVTFSEQRGSTDTIAMAGDGSLLRDGAGHPVLRPGGHGALIENLNALEGDLVLVKNIDNVAHEHARDCSLEWIQLLGGYLVLLQGAIHEHVRALREGSRGAIPAARDFVQLTFPAANVGNSGETPADRDRLLAQLERPLRVCGMVKNEGEPGGGPFWVNEPGGGTSLQIVESAELDQDDRAQQEIFAAATHFNPVFMALAVRDEGGRPFDLRQFVEPDRVITASKQVNGRPATVLERPGLWNGSMARWNSVFVEVPIGVFSPVKSVLDLLRDEHQPSGTTEASAGGSAR